MPRPASGSVVERATRDGRTSFAIRFRARGERRFVTLGYSAAWTRRRAEEELANVLADVRRGVWRSPEEVEVERRAAEVPSTHEFASEWYARREQDGLRPRTLEHIRWTLTDHLLPYFAAERNLRVDQVTPAEVDRYVARKLAEGQLSRGSIRRTLQTLSTIMALAVEHGHVASNPVAGPLRRLKADKPSRLFLEPPQVAALLEAASELDAEDRARRRYRRPLLATLAYAGLRVGELLALTWRDVDLAGGRIRVRQSKTEAGVRSVDLQPELRDDLIGWKASTAHPEPRDLVFPTATGAPDDRNAVRRRVLLRAVARANERIADDGGCEPLPDGLSPHALRRSFASWLVAEGEDAAYVMEQLGHVDPAMTLGLYARALQSKRRRPHARRQPDAMNGHRMATEAAETASAVSAQPAA
jgi:integrase